MKIIIYFCLLVAAFYCGKFSRPKNAKSRAATVGTSSIETITNASADEKSRQPASAINSPTALKTSEKEIAPPLESSLPFHYLFRELKDYEQSWRMKLSSTLDDGTYPKEERIREFSERAAKSVNWKSSIDVATSKGLIHMDAYLALLQDENYPEMKCAHMETVFSLATDRSKYLGSFQTHVICEQGELHNEKGFVWPVWTYDEPLTASYLSVVYVPIFKSQAMTYFDGEEEKKQSSELTWIPSSREDNEREFQQQQTAYYTSRGDDDEIEPVAH